MLELINGYLMHGEYVHPELVDDFKKLSKKIPAILKKKQKTTW